MSILLRSKVNLLNFGLSVLISDKRRDGIDVVQCRSDRDQVWRLSLIGAVLRRKQMNDTVRILGIAGSLRRDSYNRSALRAAIDLVPEGARIETFELDEIPIFNQDHEQDPHPSV